MVVLFFSHFFFKSFTPDFFFWLRKKYSVRSAQRENKKWLDGNEIYFLHRCIINTTKAQTCFFSYVLRITAVLDGFRRHLTLNGQSRACLLHVEKCTSFCFSSKDFRESFKAHILCKQIVSEIKQEHEKKDGKNYNNKQERNLLKHVGLLMKY